ncbi:MAG: NB-ARC domain-containing protein [Chloroflexota bacterium]
MDHKQLLPKVRKALQQWHHPTPAESPISDLLLFRQLQQETAWADQRTANQILLDAIEQLKQDGRGIDAEYLELHYQEEITVIQLVHRWDKPEATVRRRGTDAIKRLTSVILEQENQHLAQWRVRQEGRLEAPDYVALVGVEEHCATLLAELHPLTDTTVVGIEGIGGLGKTALAHGIVTRVIDEHIYDDIGWVSIRQTRLTPMGMIRPVSSIGTGTLSSSGEGTTSFNTDYVVRALITQLMPDTFVPTDIPLNQAIEILRNHLATHPHLIVIDNLETAEDIHDILPTVQLLADPSKFILTSRESLQDAYNIYHFNIPELSATHALALIRQEARASNLAMLAESPEDELMPIYDTVGGNPLALRLVVGLSHKDVLADILDDLKGARTQSVENLYTYIYWEAWRRLSAHGQEVLMRMSSASSRGVDMDFLQAMCGMEKDPFRKGLDELIPLKLIDVRGTPYDRRFHIHSLTRTFLTEQVAQWGVQNPS